MFNVLYLYFDLQIFFNINGSVPLQKNSSELQTGIGRERERECVEEEEGLLACVRCIVFVFVFRFSNRFYINGSDPQKKKLE